MRRRKTLDQMSVPELVKFYGSGNGADDAAGPEFRRRGVTARDELIRMLETIPAGELRESREAETIAIVLEYHFPSQESTSALERLQRRKPGPVQGSLDALRLTSLRAQLSGHMNEAWWGEHEQKSPAEADLHYTEMLLEHARPQDRIEFLVDAVLAAAACYDAARELNNRDLELANAAKAESYARQVLAIPDLASQSGSAVYHANHVLGMLALGRGDVEAAKRHLIAASRTPGAWALNRAPYGPDWRLALALLEMGERDTVCEFLDNVKVFAQWAPMPTPTPKAQLIDRWKKVIRSGGPSSWTQWREEWCQSNLRKSNRKGS